MSDFIEFSYGDVKKQWKNGYYFQAIANGYFAPYAALFKAIGDFLKTDSNLSEDDGKNIERIILAGEKSGARKIRIKIDKDELTGANFAMGKIKSIKSNIKTTLGKESESKYFIEVEYGES